MFDAVRASGVELDRGKVADRIETDPLIGNHIRMGVQVGKTKQFDKLSKHFTIFSFPPQEHYAGHKGATGGAQMTRQAGFYYKKEQSRIIFCTKLVSALSYEKEDMRALIDSMDSETPKTGQELKDEKVALMTKGVKQDG